MPNGAALEFHDLFAMEDIETEISDGPDYFEKFYKDAELGVALGGAEHVVGLAKEVAVIDRRATAIFKKIAASAEQSAGSKKPASEPSTLEKRFSVDPRAGYREYFREQCALGKSASQVLDAWLAEFPHHNPTVENMLRAVAAEF